jgi:Flp pilus assembly protein TadG
MKQRRNERGQSLVETALTIILFMAIALGLLTFGHAFMVTNMITHAARDGARLAATWPNRGSCQAVTNTSALVQTVRNEIATVTGGTFTVSVQQVPDQTGLTPPNCAPSTTPAVKVRVQGCVPYVFPILPANLGVNCNGQKGFTVDRSVTFHDEGI